MQRTASLLKARRLTAPTTTLIDPASSGLNSPVTADRCGPSTVPDQREVLPALPPHRTGRRDGGQAHRLAEE